MTTARTRPEPPSAMTAMTAMTLRELQLLRWFGRADFREQIERRRQVEQTWRRVRQGLRRR